MIMVAPRRFLPSISLLSAFEAAARTENFTAAAEELSLTQGAVSRQIQALEEQLGIALFRREKKRVHLTAAGHAYAREIREALKLIARASLSVQANPEGGTLNLAILPTFGTRWLAPRLNAFLAGHPGVTVNLSTRILPFDLEAEHFDAAIQYGPGTVAGTEHIKLLEEALIPVSAPGLKDQLDVRTPADVARAPLLHIETRPKAWQQWLEAQGVSATATGGLLFDQFATIAQAAIHGVGFALLPRFLIEQELSEGRLVVAFDRPLYGIGGYYLTWPKAKGDYPPLARFRDWIVAEITAWKRSRAEE
ncbi:MAG: LysR family transcriptional regulator [Alphaproteobacteria bacterium]|nr:MAG: LysR family transcriptional regulator [Alphaproteobacteria bacterium]